MLLISLALLVSRPALSAEAQRELYPIIVASDGNGGHPYKLGFIDRRGRVVITPRFQRLCGEITGLPEFHEGLASLGAASGAVDQGYIDSKGQFAIPPTVRGGDFHEGIAWVGDQQPTDSGLAWIDRTGKIFVPRKFHTSGRFYQNQGTDFSEGMLRIEEGDSWGFVDRAFNWVIPPRYFRAFDFHEGLALVYLDGTRTAFIDRTGKEIVSLPGKRAESDLSGGLAAVSSTSDHRWGLIDRAGREVIPLQFRYTLALGEGFGAAANSEGKLALFNSRGKQLTPFQFRAIGGGFNRGMVAASLQGERTWGYIDPSGAWVLPAQFQEALSFSGDLARVMFSTGHFGYIDRRGKVVWTGGVPNPCVFF